jgi:hypothetical protein
MDLFDWIKDSFGGDDLTQFNNLMALSGVTAGDAYKP